MAGAKEFENRMWVVESEKRGFWVAICIQEGSTCQFTPDTEVGGDNGYRLFHYPE